MISPFVIGFTLLIIGFVILSVAVLPKLFGANSLPDRSACHLSVLARGTLPIGQEISPLRCSAEKICITDSLFGQCAQFHGEKGVMRIRVNSADEASAARVIERELANAMYGCWTMMGEGKIDVVSRPGIFETASNTCVVCTRVAIDASTIGDSILDKTDLNHYLATELVPGSTSTYLELFLDKGIASYVGQGETGAVDISSGTKEFRSRDLVILFSQIRTRDADESAQMVALGGISIGAGGLLTSTGRAAVRAVWPLAVLHLAVTGVESLNAYQTALEGQAVAMGYCGEVKSPEDARAGCSIVKTMTFDAEAINAFCTGGLQGNL